MEPVGISWLVASSSSPLIAVLALWTIYVFHTYRRRWRTVDLFLLAVTSQELVTSIFAFSYSIISLINPPFRIACNFTQWGLIASRTFQVATLTSMVVDRALTVRWPYRYRFSVRRNQIRYHIAVLALVSILVGVAAVFARVPKDNKHCYLHPAQWDIKYIVFLLSLYGILMIVSFICMIQVECHRNRHGTKLGADGSFQLPECASPDLPSATGMNSPLDTQSSTGSTRALHRPSRQASRRPYGKNAKGTSDLRWPSVALTSLICFSLNHIPHLVLMSLATWSPYLWSPWHEAILEWLRLLEGVFVPLLLFCKDHALRSALRRTFQRRSGALSPLVGDDGPFQMYFDKDHFRKRGTFGSVTPIGIITNYRRTPGKKRRKTSGKYTFPGLHSGDSVLAKSCFLGTEPLSKLSCADLTSLGMWKEDDEENFYATLSDDFSTFSCKSADDSALSEDIRISEELYGGSFTTIANDDFEFHDTRPCGGEVKMKPALSSTPPKNNSFNAGFSRNVSFKDNMQRRDDLSSNISYERKHDLFDFAGQQDDEDKKDPDLFAPPPAEWNDNEDSINSSPSETQRSTPPRESSTKLGTMSRPQKATSYSMNDLDLIHHGVDQGKEFETTFVLPVKSESTMSLYRLNVERDLDQMMMMSPSKSETNVNGDSGFGSGAQSTNPVWSGFLCRKPSDPFWNMRKPTTHAAVTPTRNYPGILHPRMRKIPWISAWKKLDENSDLNSRRQIADSQLKDKVGWKDNKQLVFTANVERDIKTTDKLVGTIDEELSDASSPLFNADYNLNIFAKESGVLLENAYGKIVRDDCGVKVNFYGENVQYDARDSIYCKESSENVFDNSFESKKLNYDQNKDQYNFPAENTKIENHYEPLNVVRNSEARSSMKSEDIYNARSQLVENIFCSNVCSTSDPYKCEPRLNGGHYENLFGTKENIFAQCDQYIDRSKLNSNVKGKKVERRSSGRRDSNQLKNSNNMLYHADGDSVYGHLKKMERGESFSRKFDAMPECQRKDIPRRESDNRGKKCGVKRKESRNRGDKRERDETPDDKAVCERKPSFAEFENKAKIQEDSNKNRIEIEMKNVCDLNCNNRFSGEDVRCNLVRRESQNRRSRENSTEKNNSKFEYSDNQKRCEQRVIEKPPWKTKLEKKDSQTRGKDGSRDRKQTGDFDEQKCVDPNLNIWKVNVERTDSGKVTNIQRRDSNRCAESSGKCLNIERRDSGRCTNVERRDSSKQINKRQDNCQTGVERHDSGRQQPNAFLRKEEFRNGIYRRDSQNRKNEVKNEGLWVNAIPFNVQSSNCNRDEENGNATKGESKKEPYDLQRSPRKNNLPRKDSKTKNERAGGDHVRRKVSANRGRKEKHEQDCEGRNKAQRKDFPGRTKWTNHNENNLDDFAKYRDKCKDNFSHIQNINRETSAERESSKKDQLVSYGKLNGVREGEIFPFDSSQDQRKEEYASKPTYDINDNCRQKKLAITDFL